MPQVVIIGSSFAALTSVKILRKEGYQGEITLIAPKPELFYFPSLIWVPAGLRSKEDLTIHLEDFFRRHRVDYVPGRVTGLDPEKRRVKTADGEIAYERLLIASGGRFIKKLPGIEHIYTPCEGWEATKAFSDRLARMDGGTVAFGFAGNPKEPSAMRGGPIFEFVFGVDTLLRKQGRRDRFRLVFFSPAPKPGKRLGEKAVDRILGEMERRGIETHLGHKMKGFTEDRIETEGGGIDADLTLFMPGMTGPAWAAESGLPLSEGGFIQADAHCRVPGVDGVYVAGDSGSFPGPDWMPKQAHIADLQAAAAARNLLADFNGRPGEHTFKPELICIVDTLDSGVLVYRGPKRSALLGGFFLHRVKRLFEWWYLRAFR
jgi:sulfide:quinone oxidoreductase